MGLEKLNKEEKKAMADRCYVKLHEIVELPFTRKDLTWGYRCEDIADLDLPVASENEVLKFVRRQDVCKTKHRNPRGEVYYSYSPQKMVRKLSEKFVIIKRGE